MKLLIIEDERQLSDSIAEYLSVEDYVCEQAFTYPEAESRIEAYDYDCILLDIMIPGGNGIGLLSVIRKRMPDTGVIIVSAKDSLDDKVQGLRLGADDYLAKLFHLSELSIRIFALLRRKYLAADGRIRTGRVEIDLLGRRVEVDGKCLSLTRSEYDLLLFLVENRRRIVSKSAVAEHLTGDMADMLDDFNFIYAHIKNLKAKLAAAGVSDCIKTFYGTGYKWNIQE